MSDEPESTGERFARSVVELGRQWRGERFSSVRVWPSDLTERETQITNGLLGEIEVLEARVEAAERAGREHAGEGEPRWLRKGPGSCTWGRLTPGSPASHCAESISKSSGAVNRSSIGSRLSGGAPRRHAEPVSRSHRPGVTARDGTTCWVGCVIGRRGDDPMTTMETQTAQNWRSLPMFMPFNEAPPEEQERRRKRVRALRRPYDLAARVQQRTKWQPRLAARRERIT